MAVKKTDDTVDGVDKPADIAPATGFHPSGAPDQVTDIDVDHPAVDNNPRADTSALQNRADFNDPTLSSAEAVKKNLEAQGSDIASGTEKSEK
jgi:hypothetical protein